MKTVRLGLIGLGYMGRIHLRNCLKVRSAKLVAVSDVSPKARMYAKNLGVKYVHEDFKELLKSRELDAVIVSLPTHLHSLCAMISAESRKHMLLEKPLARNPAEGGEIVRACRNNDVKLMVGYHFRFSPQFCRLKRDLVEGELGEAQIAQATMVGPGPFSHRSEGYAPRQVPSWWFDKESTGGGALMDLGCHMINLVRWYFGDIKETKCLVGHRFNLDFEDYAMCTFKMKSGTVAMVTTGYFSREASAKVEIFGTSKIAVAKREASNRVVTFFNMLLGLTPKFNLPYLWELQSFVDCLNNDRTPTPSGEDGLKDLETIAWAYRDSSPIDDYLSQR